ncbi:hypothetical protein BELL_0740g00020 [Botrytis elliptica]|uniref:Uncharacterized protein n=1 Tax=Botrytis elliptica TaxID=278938 RepID=A0A4Z1JFI7_9HELO|nr:hypothetical protein EAE99_006622 [Botrytis elliptica]TGO70102.1 hypothetical protein BELL_0740g00020 [Botrytis elliptica]
MSHHEKLWRGDDDGKKGKKQARPPARQYNERGPWNTVSHALGVYVSPWHKYSIHVYLIFHRFDNMPSGKFVATMSFRTMYNDFRGMKTMDLSPASEDADPLFDENGGDLSGVMVARRTFACKIGWTKRFEEKDSLYLRVAKCLPLPIRPEGPEGMNDEEWEEVRPKGPRPRTEWVLEAIRALREDRHWESLPMKQFQARHDEVKEVAGRKRRAFGLRSRSSFDMEQARCLDKIMNDVGTVLYSKREEELEKNQRRHRKRGMDAGF